MILRKEHIDYKGTEASLSISHTITHDLLTGYHNRYEVTLISEICSWTSGPIKAREVPKVARIFKLAFKTIVYQVDKANKKSLFNFLNIFNED